MRRLQAFVSCLAIDSRMKLILISFLITAIKIDNVHLHEHEHPDIRNKFHYSGESLSYLDVPEKNRGWYVDMIKEKIVKKPSMIFGGLTYFVREKSKCEVRVDANCVINGEDTFNTTFYCDPAESINFPPRQRLVFFADGPILRNVYEADYVLPIIFSRCQELYYFSSETKSKCKQLFKQYDSGFDCWSTVESNLSCSVVNQENIYEDPFHLVFMSMLTVLYGVLSRSIIRMHLFRNSKFYIWLFNASYTLTRTRSCTLDFILTVTIEPSQLQSIATNCFMFNKMHANK